MKKILEQLWIEGKIATFFLREGRTQSLMITAMLVASMTLMIFIPTLMQGLHLNTVQQSLHTQAHIRMLPIGESNIILKPSEGTLQLVQEDKRVQRAQSIDNWEQVFEILDDFHQLKAISPIVSGSALLTRGEEIKSVDLMGIDLINYQKIIPLQNFLKEGQLHLGQGNVVISSRLATDLGAQVGSKLRIESGQGNNMLVNVAGIVDLGEQDFNSRVYTDLKQAQFIIGLSGITSIDLALTDMLEAQEISAQIAHLTGLEAENWIETNVALKKTFSAQSLSSNFIIICLVLFLISSITSILLLNSTQYIREINILCNASATRIQMIRIFFFQGLILFIFSSVLVGFVSYIALQVFNNGISEFPYVSMSAKFVLLGLGLGIISSLLAVFCFILIKKPEITKETKFLSL